MQPRGGVTAGEIFFICFNNTEEGAWVPQPVEEEPYPHRKPLPAGAEQDEPEELPLAEKTESFRETSEERHLGQVIFSLSEVTSSSNSKPQLRHVYSNIGMYYFPHSATDMTAPIMAPAVVVTYGLHIRGQVDPKPV